METKANKNFIIGIAIAAVLVLVLIIVWISMPKEELLVPEEITEEPITEIERQLSELEELRKGVLPLTEEEIQKQLEELEKLRQLQ